MKKLTAILLTVLLAISMLAFVGCGTTQSVSGDETKGTETQSGEQTPVNDDVVYNVGIVQLVQHDALDQATEGFKAALTEKLGDKVTFDYKNASGDAINCSSIVSKFVADDVDLIMANATPAVQAAKEKTNTIPIVGTSVTDYVASGLVDSNDKPGANVTGVSDMNAVANQLDLVKKFAPEAKNIGVVYCSAEDNSVIQFNEAKKVFEEAGYTVTPYTASDANALNAVCAKAVKESDVIYEPTDNLLASNMEILKNAAVPAKVPVICGEQSMCEAGGVASYSISYYNVGYEAGLMAYEILVNGKSPAETPVKIFGPEDLTLIQNKEVMAEMGITPIEE